MAPFGSAANCLHFIRQRLLILCRQTYEDVAKPLEPLVIVFVLFGVPAALMATDYCKENSSARSQSVSISVNSDNTAISYGVCDTACELALAFRSLATVIVYFLRKERRQEAWALGTLWARLKSRSGKFFFSAFGRSVHFDEDRLERVQMIPSGECRATFFSLAEKLNFTRSRRR